jgi:protein-serine/threonine kinase
MKVIKKDNVDNKHAVSQVLAERQVLAKTIDSPFLVGLKFR